jgi:hypothetical protein
MQRHERTTAEKERPERKPALPTPEYRMTTKIMLLTGSGLHDKK